MKISEFVDLATKNANLTTNIRVYNNWTGSGVYRIPDEISSHFGKIIALIQTQIDKKAIVEKNQCLILYNFQPLFVFDDAYYCSLDMVTKPLSKISENNLNEGKVSQLVINGTTGEVMNNAKGMLEINDHLETGELYLGETEPSTSYGNFYDYLPPYPENSNKTLAVIPIQKCALSSIISHNIQQGKEMSAEDLVEQSSDIDVKKKLECLQTLFQNSPAKQNLGSALPITNSFSPFLGFSIEHDKVPNISDIQHRTKVNDTFVSIQTTSLITEPLNNSSHSRISKRTSSDGDAPQTLLDIAPPLGESNRNSSAPAAQRL